MKSELITGREASEILGVHPHTFRRIKERLNAVHLYDGSRARYRRADVIALYEEMQDAIPNEDQSGTSGGGDEMP